MTLHFVWRGLGFACFVGILLIGPRKIGRVYRLLGDGWVRVVLGMVLFILLSTSAAEIGFR